MTEVIFSAYNFRKESRDEKEFIFDDVRKKFVALTPEEWVRQHVLHYLIHEKKYPRALIAVETQIDLNDTIKRCDAVVYSRDSKPILIIECKAPEEKLDEKVFEQIARYNLKLRVPYWWVTNGTHNYFCEVRKELKVLNEVPEFSELV